jgi:hypothetical protein
MPLVTRGIVRYHYTPGRQVGNNLQCDSMGEVSVVHMSVVIPTRTVCIVRKLSSRYKTDFDPL